MEYDFCMILSSLITIFNLYNLKFIILKHKHIIILSLIICSTVEMINIISKKIGVFGEMLLAPSIFIIIIIYLYILTKNFLLSTLSCSISILILLVIDGIMGYIMTCIFYITQSPIFELKHLSLWFNLLLFGVNFFGVKLVKFYFYKLLLKNNRKKDKVMVLIATNIVIILIVVYVLCMISKLLKTHLILLGISTFLSAVLCTSTIVIFYIYEEYMKKDLHAMYTSRELNQLKQYVSAVENMYNEMRKMKHDYVNVLCSINGYVEEGNSKELKRYFNENILNLNDSLSISSGNLMKLKHIKVEGVKGLIFSKMLQSKSKSVELFLDISEDIEKFYIESIDLCRILGIFWDNAIEEAELCSNGKIKFGVIILENSMVIVLINSCRNNIPYIYKMFEHGFSTKGENRGIGLSNVKELIDKKYDNVTLNTYIDNGEFKQEIIIDYK